VAARWRSPLGTTGNNVGRRGRRVREDLAGFVATPPILIAARIEAVMHLGYGALGFLPIYAKIVGLRDADRNGPEQLRFR
jgi:hypothetical protein